MANDLNIDSLSIEIEATSSGASKNIDTLTSSLSNLKTATNGFNKLKTIADNLKGFSNIDTSGIDKLATSLAKMNGADKNIATVVNAISRLGKSTDSLNSTNFGNMTTQVSSLVTAFAPLKELEKTNLGATISQLKKLPEIATQLNGIDFTRVAQQITLLTKSLEPLKVLEKTNLGYTFNQLKKLPEIVAMLDTVDLSKFATQIQKVATALVPLANQTQKISGVFSRLPFLVKSAGTQFDKYSAKISKASGFNKTFALSLSNVIGKFRTFQIGATMISAGLGSIFEESSQYIENLNLFNVAMGDATESALEFAQKVQDVLNIDMSDWMNYQGTFNMLISGFGVSSDKAQIMSQNLTQLAYDYSSLINVPVDDAFGKLNSAMSGQIKGLKEFGNNVSVAMVKQTGLKYGLSGAVSSWDQQTQAIMRYVTIMNNASNVDVFNDMARTIATPANAVRILSQQFTQLKRAVGDIANVFIAKLIPYIQMFVQVLTDAANAIASFFGFELPEINYSGLAGGGLSDDADEATDAVDGTTAAVKTLKKQLMGFDELNILQAETDTDSDSGSGSGSGGLQSVGDIELPEYDFLAGLENSTNESLERIKAKLATLFEPISSSWAKYGGFVTDSMGYAFSAIRDLIGSIGSDWMNVWQNGTGEKTVSTILQIIGYISTGIGHIATNFTKAWNTGGTGKQIIQNIWDIVNLLLDSVKEVAKEFALWTANLNFDGLLGFIKKLTGGFKDILSYIDPLVLGIGLLATKFLGFKGIGVVLQTFGAIGSAVFGNFAPLLTMLQSTLAPLQPLITGISTAVSTLGAIGTLVFGLIAITITDLLLTSEEFRESFFSIFESVFEILSSLWNGIGAPIFEAVISVMESVWENGLKPLYDTWKEVFTAVFGLVADLLKVLSPIIDAVVKLLGPVIAIALGIFSGLFSGTINTVLGIMNGLLTSVRDIIESVRKVFSGIIDFIVGIFTGDWRRAWEGIKSILEGIVGLFVSIMKTPINGVIGLINGMISGVETGINFLVKCVNKLSFDVPDWVPGIGGESFGFDFPKVKLGRIEYLADGGFPDMGQMFVAREAGPELVGQIGSKNAVVNNDQIIAGISSGVYSAVVSAMAGNSGKGGNVTIHVHTEIDRNEIGKATVEYHNGVVKQTGNTPLLI